MKSQDPTWGRHPKKDKPIFGKEFPWHRCGESEILLRWGHQSIHEQLLGSGTCKKPRPGRPGYTTEMSSQRARHLSFPGVICIASVELSPDVLRFFSHSFELFLRGVCSHGHTSFLSANGNTPNKHAAVASTELSLRCGACFEVVELSLRAAFPQIVQPSFCWHRASFHAWSFVRRLS